MVHGYNYKGIIMNDENPLQNFFLFLYEISNNSTFTYTCDKPEIKLHPLSHKHHKYLCYEISDSEGAFLFKDLPYGDYRLALKATEDDKRVEIEPLEANIAIRHMAIQQKLQFQVNRFTIQGQVIDTKGLGINQVTISLDGEEKTKTDEKGFYYLERIRTGTYTLEGLHDHLFFEPIHDLKLSIGLKQVPNLVLTYIHVCGKVLLNFENLFQEVQENNKYKITMFLEDIKGEKRTTAPDNTGNYCFEAKPGNYTVYPVIDRSMTEISFSPQKHAVFITNTPKLDLNFHRPKISIHGNVEFLKGLGKELIEKTKVKISCLVSQKTIIHDISATGEFLIKNVLSGNYELTVDNEDLCWEKTTIPLEISQNANITGLKFKQNGFALRYEVQGAIEAEVTNPKGLIEMWNFSQESAFRCVTDSGEYVIKPHECASYKENSFKYDTDHAKKLSFLPEKHLIAGQIKFNFSKSAITREIYDRLPLALNHLNYLNIESSSINQPNMIEKADIPLIYQRNLTENDTVIFTYRHYVSPFTINRIFPKPNSTINLDKNLQSILENLLFYPPKREIKILQSCQLKETDFLIKSGLILTGKVLPNSLDDVKITIFQDNKSIQTVNLINGSFKIGPLSDNAEYRIEAEKLNYRFSQSEPLLSENNLFFSLIAQKLSVIKVLVQDLDKKAIAGVNVFISSTAKNEKLNLNNITDKNGLFISNNLVKGEYMVKCSLKEYSFEPNQKTVKILEGDNAEITILGKQIAFSIYGKVLRLSQEGLEGSIVEIYQENQLKDTIVTNSQGIFRIRALEPFQHYSLSLKAQENLHYYKPKTIEIEMKDHDVMDLEFIVFEKKAKFSIMGTVEFDDKFTKEEIDDFQGFELEIYEFNDQNTPLIEIRRLQVNRYFEFEELNMKQFVIKVTYKRTKNSLTQELSKIYNLKDLGENDFQMYKKIVIPKLGVENKKGTTQTFSLLAPVVLLILLISLLNLDATKDVLASFVSFLKKK